ncbi:MAG: indolepyruvate oxidoreductase subunit beta [Deltaproteobacteria bacterium]|nr:indolepyruvate oxidoreductase subunit beta [Deltaproteobacteria bacterium]NIS78478.1 indolepyruvate oxidoreductase subunit beta [Deltaproteobacteria bacterium]
MKGKGNVIFCGVGGQGILLASELTSLALLAAGFDVKKSEVHGMAQRGGSVVAHLRYGRKVFSPLIENGAADVVVSFELVESLRYLSFMNRKTKLIVNSQRIFPPSVATGLERYPEGVLERFHELGVPLFPVDALEVATSLGEVRALNMVLVGALSNFVPVDEDDFFGVISGKVPEKLLEVNWQAFSEGRRVVEKALMKA